ncbi:Proteasome assembly chaperone 3 [Bienertia sinuspersici]
MDSSPAGFPVLHKKLTVDIKCVHFDTEGVSGVVSRVVSSRHAILEVGEGVRRIKTDLIICQYEDHYLVSIGLFLLHVVLYWVIVTQLGSMGTLLQAKKEEGVSVLPTFNVSVIFGKRDEPMLVACARQLIEIIR